jgi:hypothetical protein
LKQAQIEPKEAIMEPIPMADSFDARSMRRLKMDEHGHAIPPTPEENAADTEALLIALAEMAAIPDDPAEPDEVFWRAMDESHPERPGFKDFYKQ